MVLYIDEFLREWKNNECNSGLVDQHGIFSQNHAVRNTICKIQNFRANFGTHFEVRDV